MRVGVEAAVVEEAPFVGGCAAALEAKESAAIEARALRIDRTQGRPAARGERSLTLRGLRARAG
jgi:hypothetical protein